LRLHIWLVSLDGGAGMLLKRRVCLSLVFACICLSKSLLIRITLVIEK